MQFPSGLALYWVISNVVTIVIQYYMTGGWGGLAPAAKQAVGRDKKYIKYITRVEEKPVDYAEVEADIPADVAEQGAGQKLPTSLRTISRHPKKGKSHRPKRR
jgi:membrane protein insertase Oxa1/YidC/SpoIIIJ